MAAAQLAALQNLQHGFPFNRGPQQTMVNCMQKEKEQQSERDEGKAIFEDGELLKLSSVDF
jgi:hypothetical protein